MRGTYAHKVDRNQGEIVAACEGVGASVQPLNRVGDGCFDLLVGFRGLNFVLEVKDPLQDAAHRKLTPSQVRWDRDWRGHRAIVYTADDALRAIGVIR